MPLFQYQAFDNGGQIRKGTYDAATENEVRQYLKSIHLFPKVIKLSKSAGKKFEQLQKLRKYLPGGQSYHNEVTQFTRQMEILLEATIPYDKALEMILTQSQNAGFQAILSDLRARVVEGEHLAEALNRYPQVFPAMYVSMVRSGENSGNLDMIMGRLANHYENQAKLRSKLRSSMIYPIFMSVFGLVVVIFMMTFIVPKITSIFEHQKATLPLPTRILIGISNLVTEHWFLLFLGLLVLMVSVTAALRSPRGVHLLASLELRLPLVKTLVIKVLVLRFCQTLGTLLKSGVDLKSALEISKFVVVNPFVIEKLNQLIIDVNNKGIPLSSAMQRVSYFPDYVCHVVAIGEQAAKVDELLEKVAERMQLEVMHTMEGLTSLLQPVMILLMGAVVGFIAISVLLPMLNMNQLLQP